jgi:uncharacterized membrane protein YbhN (UPF0104 family)
VGVSGESAVVHMPAPTISLWYRWRSVAFAPVGDGQRRRRGSDGLRLVAAVLALLVCLLIIRYGYRVDRVITRVVYPPPASISWLVTVVYDAGAFGITAMIVVLALLARRLEVARDIALSVIGTAAVTGLLVLLVGSDGGRGPGTAIHGYSVTFPVLQIAAFMAVATASLPYLARTLQRLVQVFIVLVALASVVGGHGLPINVLGSMAIGWGVTAIVHLVFGSPLGLPSSNDVVLLLQELGVAASDVQSSKGQEWGVARYGARLESAANGPFKLAISVYGRDATDAKLLSKAGRFLLYRDSGPTLTLTRLQEVEREAYLTMWAAQIGVSVPHVVQAGQAGPSGDALLICLLPDGVRLSGVQGEAVTDRMLDSLFAQLILLRGARLAHGALSGETVQFDLVAETASLVNFRKASTGASDDRLDADMAGAIASVSLVVGADRAAESAARSLTSEVLGAALRHLRSAGFDPVLVRALRAHKGLLDQVREKAAAVKSIEVPKLVEPRRISIANLVLVIGTMIGGWALIGVLIDVTNSFDTIIGADWIWVAAVFLLGNAAFVGTAVEDLGSVSGSLQFIRVLALEIGESFSGIAGGTAMIFATRVRFFQQQGYTPSVAVSSSAIVTASSWIVKALLFLISLPLAWSTIHLGEPNEGGNSNTVWVILVVVVSVLVVVGLVLAVPKVRRLVGAKLRPRIQEVWGNARSVASSPRKVVLLIGGSIGGQLAVALALAASLRAFGDHLSLATLFVVMTLSSMIGGVSPVPGGVGVVEAGLILGLTAAGISESDATAAVFVQRLFTAYLPPIWGWFCLLWLRRREYI